MHSIVLFVGEHVQHLIIIVVCSYIQLANEFASQLSSHEKDTFSNMLKRTFHGFLGHATDRPPLSTRHSVSAAYPAVTFADGKPTASSIANLTSSGPGASIQRQESTDKAAFSSTTAAHPSITKTLFSYFSGVGGLGKSYDSHHSSASDHRSEAVDNPMTAHTAITPADNNGHIGVGGSDTLTYPTRSSPSLSAQNPSKHTDSDDSVLSEDLAISSHQKKMNPPGAAGRGGDSPPVIAADGSDEQRLFEQFVSTISDSESPSTKKEKESYQHFTEKESNQAPPTLTADIAEDDDIVLSFRPCKKIFLVFVLANLLFFFHSFFLTF